MGTFIYDSTTTLFPSITQMAGTLPAAGSTCTTFAQLTAAPFNGKAQNYDTGSTVRTV